MTDEGKAGTKLRCLRKRTRAKFLGIGENKNERHRIEVEEGTNENMLEDK